MKDETINFYDKESGIYTAKRYPNHVESYTQYIFRTRLNILLSFLKKSKQVIPINSSVFEIGCADGVVFKSLEGSFPHRFSKLVGVDISPGMIAEATKQNTNKNTSFTLRDAAPADQYDIVLEIGVHVYNLDAELAYVSQFLKPNGYFVFSAAGGKSLYKKIKMRDKEYSKDYLVYSSLEKVLQRYFTIEDSAVYGLFVPKLWQVGALGRFLQPIFDGVFQFIPELFHEKIYLLRKLD